MKKSLAVLSCLLAFSALPASAQQDSSRSAIAVGVAQGEILQRIAREHGFVPTKVDFSHTYADRVVPRGGGTMVNVTVMLDIAVVCKALVVVGEDSSVREFYWRLGATGCGDPR